MEAATTRTNPAQQLLRLCEAIGTLGANKFATPDGYMDGWKQVLKIKETKDVFYQLALFDGMVSKLESVVWRIWPGAQAQHYAKQVKTLHSAFNPVNLHQMSWSTIYALALNETVRFALNSINLRILELHLGELSPIGLEVSMAPHLNKIEELISKASISAPVQMLLREQLNAIKETFTNFAFTGSRPVREQVYRAWYCFKQELNSQHFTEQQRVEINTSIDVLWVSVNNPESYEPNYIVGEMLAPGPISLSTPRPIALLEAPKP